MSSPKLKPRGCGSCRFADWSRDPRPRAKGPGDCRFEPVVVPLPHSIVRAHGFREQREKVSIWKDDGASCPCWEREETA